MDYTSGYYLDVNPYSERPYNYQLYKYLFDDELKYFESNGHKKTINTKKGISVATALKATKSGAVALFAPSKGGKSGVEALAEESIFQLENITSISLKEYSPSEFLNHLSEYFTVVFGSDYLLTRCSNIGVLFHHGDFPQNIREVIEDAFWTGSSPGPSLTTTFCGREAPTFLVSRLMLLMTVVLLRMVVLFTITVEGRIGLSNRDASTKANCGPATTAPCGPRGAQPI